MALNNKKNLINILYGNKDDENLIDVDKSGYNQNALVVYLWIYIPIPTMIMLIVYTWDVYVLECIGHLNNCYVKEISYVCTIRYSWIPLHVVFSNFFLSASKGRHLVFHRILIFFWPKQVHLGT